MTCYVKELSDSTATLSLESLSDDYMGLLCLCRLLTFHKTKRLLLVAFPHPPQLADVSAALLSTPSTCLVAIPSKCHLLETLHS